MEICIIEIFVKSKKSFEAVMENFDQYIILEGQLYLSIFLFLFSDNIYVFSK